MTESADTKWAASNVAACEELLGDAVCSRIGIYSLPSDFVLTVIVPIFNEVGTIDDLVGRLRATGLPLQLVLVDDGSGDGSGDKLDAYVGAPSVTVIRHAANRGKGAAIRSGLEVANGQVIVIQDADREYDPEDFRYLLQPILEGRADVVYGTRYGHSDRQVSPLWHAWVNGWLTRLANLAIGLQLSDVETCYKMAHRDAWLAIRDELREERFGIEIELTARWARRKMRFYERPIRYQHRWYAEGKKIGWKDGVAALGCILRYGVLRQ
jgi:glycosyltransferase involved in cell wall biosynthesis